MTDSNSVAPSGNQPICCRRNCRRNRNCRSTVCSCFRSNDLGELILSIIAYAANHHKGWSLNCGCKRLDRLHHRLWISQMKRLRENGCQGLVRSLVEVKIYEICDGTMNLSTLSD